MCDFANSGLNTELRQRPPPSPWVLTERRRRISQRNTSTNSRRRPGVCAHCCQDGLDPMLTSERRADSL